MTNRLLPALVVLNLLCLLVLMRLMPKPAQQWDYQIGCLSMNLRSMTSLKMSWS